MATIVATKQDRILLLEFNSKTNSYTMEFLKELEFWLDAAQNDAKLGAIILTSKSKLFSVGGDVGEMYRELKSNNPSGYVDKVVPVVNRIILKMLTHPLPIIAALNGAVAGGGISLVFASDHRVVMNDSKIAFAFGNLALTPDSGTSIILQNFFSRSFLLQCFTQGKIIRVDEMSASLFDRISGSREELIEQAIVIAVEYTKRDKWVNAKTKKLLNQNLIDLFEKSSSLEFETISMACKREQFKVKLEEFVNKNS